MRSSSSTIRKLSFPRGRGNDRANSPHAARRRAVHGPVQLSPERNVYDADFRPHHGQCDGLQAAHTGGLAFAPLLEAFHGAFPHGVINTVYGEGRRWATLMESGKVNVLTFIGSSQVADHLKKCIPKVNRLRAMLGLDAKNAAIVLPDADLELAVKECLPGSLSFNGQRCTALKMLIVHRTIVEIPAAVHRGARQGESRHALGQGREHHAAPGTRQGDVHDPAGRGRQVEGGPRHQRGRRNAGRHAVLPGGGLSGARRA